MAMTDQPRFGDLPPTLALEAEALALWERDHIYELGLKQAEGRPSFVFYEGPPTANGTPHNGHVLTRVIKDMVLRYRSMRGYRVPRRAGWDTHGLPVEVEVEKTLGIHGKAAIEAYGIDKFARQCRDSVFRYTREWEDLTKRIGFWVDLEQAYVTFHRPYIESVWWALSELFRKGLLYRGHKVVWWWPQGGTALSAAEVGLGYKTVDDPAVTVCFPLADDPKTSLLAWTTTPWTLPSNTAIAVNAEIDYAIVARGDQRFIIAEVLAGQVEGGTIERTVKGAELVGRRYIPPFDFAKPETGDAWRVIHAPFVTTDAGTGIAHEAPAFGEEDFQIARENGIGMLQLIAPDGCFVAGTGYLEGKFCKDADREIIRDLEQRGLLFAKATYRHEYPFCWRADSDPLIQYARPAWFIRTTARIQDALANNALVHWLPEHIKEGRFGDFLRNNVDWALSRERYWGTPLNIWICDACKAEEAPPSTAEIRARNPDAFDKSVDEVLQVHRPWIDHVTFPCAQCAGTMRRVPEVIDVWFDSGCMPFAQWGFPHKNRDGFFGEYPADFITEAVDQTRGWFYSLLMIGTLLFDDETCARLGMAPPGLPRPFRTCAVLGHVGDASGQKESKSKGNYTPPDLVLRGEMTLTVAPDASLARGALGMKQAQVKNLNLTQDERMTAVGAGGRTLPLKVVEADIKVRETVHMHPDDIAALGLAGTVELRAPFEPLGADSFRWLFSSTSPWTNTRLSLAALREGQREFLMRLRNVYNYFQIYANLLGFDPATRARPPVAERDLLDRWILHELSALTGRMTASMDAYVMHDAARDVQDFVEGLANWYVRRSRRRFWEEGPATENALWTLYEVLSTVSRLIAPFVPFQAEIMYQRLGAGRPAARSVHLTAFPEADATAWAPELAADMALVRELASLGLQARNMIGVKISQPLRRLEIVLAQPARAERLKPLLPLLADEVTVREVHFAEDADRFVEFRVKPNFRTLGPRLGKQMKACADAVAKLPASEARQQALAGALTVHLPSGPVTLGAEDVMIEVKARDTFGAAGSAAAVVALSSEIDDDLKQEGLMRDIVRRIQGLRKERELGYSDRIALKLGVGPELRRAAERFKTYICDETLATAFELIEPPPSGNGADESEVGGQPLHIWLTKTGTGPVRV
jgi:isoleucyl-tRNA synthetase